MATPMFLPTHKGQLYTELSFDARGKEILRNPVAIRYTSIRVKRDIDKTSIRTDKSASQGRGEEVIYDGRILVHPEVTPVEDQVVVLKDGKRYQVEAVQEIHESTGEIDHYQCDLLL